MAAAVVVLVAVERTHEHVQSEAIRERLIGKWTQEFVRADGSIGVLINEFVPDGHLYWYQADTPECERYTCQDVLWKVRAGELILTYDHYYSENVSLFRRMRHLWRYVRDRVRGSHATPFFRSDRILIDDPGGDTIHFSLRPDTPPGMSLVQRQVTLTRASDENLPCAEDKSDSDLPRSERLSN